MGQNIGSSVILVCLMVQTVSDETINISRQVPRRERNSRLRTLRHMPALGNMFPAPFLQVNLKP
jgi:hypothetical protein